MIEKNTVFILGAGASVPFGFPVGTGLLENIVRNAQDGYGGKIQWISNENSVKILGSKLNGSTLDSIDAFLEHKSSNIPLVRVGKLCIALSILEFELKTQYISIAGNEKKHIHWLRYLRQKMNSHVNDFSKNKVSFITFNYDRTLEHYLHHSIVNTYNLDENRAADLMKSFQIIHIHGTVAPLSWQVNDSTGLPFGFNINPVHEDVVNMFATNLKIVHEEIDKTELDKAKNLMEEAEVIYLLGFGYGEENCNRLELNRNKLGKKMKGTAYDMRSREIRDTVKRYTKVDIPDARYDCDEFLRNIILR